MSLPTFRMACRNSIMKIARIFSLDLEIVEQLRKLAKERSMTYSAVITLALKEYLKKGVREVKF